MKRTIANPVPSAHLIGFIFIFICVNPVHLRLNLSKQQSFRVDSPKCRVPIRRGRAQIFRDRIDKSLNENGSARVIARVKRHLLLGAFLMLGLQSWVFAQPEVKAPPAPNTEEDATRLVQIQVEYLELSHEALTNLLFSGEPATADGTALRKRLQEMVGKKEATVLETQLLLAKSGQKATTESIHEFIYPTEYEPPQLPCSPPIKNTAENLGDRSISGLPTAFDTRNLGSTLEVEPTLSADGKIIDLRLVPELVWHTGNTSWQETKDARDNVFRVQMPDIYSMRLNTSTTCVAGEYTLIGVVSPKDGKGELDTTRKVMVFVKCSVVAVK